MIRNRNDWPVEISTIRAVDIDDDGDARITKTDGWSLFIHADELDGFQPREGDWILTEQPVNNIATIIIEGRVLRHKTKRQIQNDHKAFSDSYHRKKLERYINEGDNLKTRAESLPLALRNRMRRFADEGGVDFWVDDAPYEMYALEGAAALLRKVHELSLINSTDHPENGPDVEGAVKWINDWWDINSDKHDPPYDYKKQMEIVPDFGDEHSGNTAGAAKALAVLILEGEEV